MLVLFHRLARSDPLPPLARGNVGGGGAQIHKSGHGTYRADESSMLGQK